MVSTTRYHHGVRRVLTHLLITSSHTGRAFPPADLQKLKAAAREGEQHHRGEVRVVIESSLPVRDAWAGMPPRHHTWALFGLLEVWNTREHASALLYINLTDRMIGILADHGIATKVGVHARRAICEIITCGFAQRMTMAPMPDASTQINDLLAAYVPSDSTPRTNELSDRSVVL